MEDQVEARFVVDLEGFEGPLDLLLELARTHKVDLARISILDLAEQFLAYLKNAQQLELRLASEYLVMAAWLAYLKSQLLLPPLERDEPDAEAVAEELAARLRRLDALRRAGEALLEQPKLHEDRFVRGAPEAVPVVRHGEIRVDLAELLRAYARVVTARSDVTVYLPPRKLDSVEAALARLSLQLANQDWSDLLRYLPEILRDDVHRRSAIASNFVAGLELARQGRLEIRQDNPFGPIMVRQL